ncbi:hypothetical protein GCM10011591_38040 [Nocardia camponoti]|uniref:Uncharacterized protein n=1 Tax=Nocardia camponoti TaxID=1616106 RepID=A0A917VCC2_9NOCA|nr:hypothetical protein GCM10011591_38040 [Nocardia camponoti]
MGRATRTCINALTRETLPRAKPLKHLHDEPVPVNNLKQAFAPRLRGERQRELALIRMDAPPLARDANLSPTLSD